MEPKPQSSPEPVEPDYWSFIEGSGHPPPITEALKKMKADGSTWHRLTQVEDGFWLAGWKVRPAEEAPFNPPMIRAIEAEIAHQKPGSEP